MSTKIQFKRGKSENLPSTLEAGEPAFTTDTNVLYVGNLSNQRANVNITGNSATSDKLKTSRTIALSEGATGTATSFDGSENISVPVTDVKEAYLSWGGKNFSGSYGPIDAAMVPELGANRLAFMPPEGIEIQYSRDGGSTWSEYATSDAEKINLFNGNMGHFYIGASEETGIDKSNYQLRIIITSNVANVYTELNKFIIYCETAGSTGSWCTIDAKTKANVDSGSDTWTNFTHKIEISGWPGYNVINTDNIRTYGNNDAQYQKLRITFGVISHASQINRYGLRILRILGFGGMGWTTPSTMATNGHMYTYDYNKNVVFPAKVTATQFNGNLNGNASKANRLTTDAGDASTPVYFENGIPKACTSISFDGIVKASPSGYGAIVDRGSSGEISAYGYGAMATGYSNSAFGNYSFVCGSNNSVSGSNGFAAGQNNNTGLYDNSAAFGKSNVATGSESFMSGVGLQAKQNQTVVGFYNDYSKAAPTIGNSTTGTVFMVGNGNAATVSNAFRVDNAGKIYAKSTSVSAGADYAEMWEWDDGNPDNEDRRGLFCTIVKDGKIKIAEPGDEIYGIISSNPSVLGDSASEEWQGKYLRDAFGEIITEDIYILETINEDGTIIPAHFEKRWKLNPDYDPSQEYVPRTERKEWGMLGMFGKIVAVDDGTCIPGGYCKCGNNGIATNVNYGYKVLKRIDDTHIKIFYRWIQ